MRRPSFSSVFIALSDPVQRTILERLGEKSRLVSELAAPFDISLQAVSRHIQVPVRAGLVHQKRTGRISRCSLVAGPIFSAAVWINSTATVGKSSSTRLRQRRRAPAGMAPCVDTE
ncbi:MAG: helix-turn-helix transcriptional regulator [Alphaproteobacteria bacterium]|nr:helix-turn-helix transcriptional regulator [Alphaproteobacteria bacterium]